MKHTALILFLAASTAAASAQTVAKPAAPAAKPATTATKPTPAASAAPATKTVVATSPTVAAIIKAPAGILQHPGIQKPIFTVALRYQDIEIGTGAVAEPNKLLKVYYTGYRAADGVKFDSSADHRMPLRDREGKPVMGEDGKPKLSDPQALPVVQGMGIIVGFEQGFTNMKVGGKRRIFIPWQLAYGTRTIPDHDPEHPGIPAKSDLIFDVELVEVGEMPPMPAPMQAHPPMGGARPMPGGPRPGALGAPGAPAQPGAPAASPVPGAAPKPPAPATPASAATPAATPAPSAAPASAATPNPAAPPATAATPAPPPTTPVAPPPPPK